MSTMRVLTLGSVFAVLATALIPSLAASRSDGEISGTYRSFPAERNTYNSNRNEDLSTRDYTRTASPYPVGAPHVYGTPEIDRDRDTSENAMMGSRGTTSTRSATSYNRDGSMNEYRGSSSSTYRTAPAR